MRNNNLSTDFLFASPSPLAGIARLADFGGTFDTYNQSATETDADAKALYLDWTVVGCSLRSAYEALTSRSR